MADATEQTQDEGTGHDAEVVALAAATLRQGTRDVELDEAPTVSGMTTLLAWGYFNPFGPTADRIDALPVGNTGELLLVLASDHESYPDYRAFALIPSGVDQVATVRDALVDIFAVNGGGDEWALVGGVPSYVHLFPDSPIDHGCAGELLRSAIATAGDRWGMPPDYSREIQDLTHTRRDPWGQAAEAVTRALQAPATQRLIAKIRLLEAGMPASLDDDDEEQVDQANDTEAGELFDLWFALVTQPAYVERIEGQMGIAWAATRAFRAGAFS